MSLYAESLPQMKKMLSNLGRWLDEAEATAKERGYDPEILTTARLFPDMFTLTRQIQSACDTAKFVGARLGNLPPPVNPDTETTLVELRARIASTLTFLDSVAEDAFDGAEDRQIFMPVLQGAWVTGTEYLRAFAMPNFYFHVTTAYDILRHNGVKLGKYGFIGHMDLHPPTASAPA